MPPVEPSAGSGDTVDVDYLRERIRVLESGLDWAVNRLGVFETAAAHRLETIQDGARIIAELQARLSETQQRQDEFAAAAAERLTVINHGAEVISRLQDQLRQAYGQLDESARAAETAAADHAKELSHAYALLQQRDSLLENLNQQTAALQDRIARLETIEPQLPLLLSQIQQLETDAAELRRGLRELAARERALTAENLELRNEGLVNSIIRRARNLFS